MILYVTLILLLWFASLILYARTFNKLYRTINDIRADLALLGVMLTNPQSRSITIPTTCASCGVPLLGPVTQHKQGCQAKRIISQFPPAN